MAFLAMNARWISRLEVMAHAKNVKHQLSLRNLQRNALTVSAIAPSAPMLNAAPNVTLISR